MVRAGRERGGDTRERIVAAAVATLRERGFAGTSAREIAKAGGFNAALIYYHFEDLPDLLLAALDVTSARRMARYQPVVERVRSLRQLAREATRLFEQDVHSGDLTVLSELMTASQAHPELGPQVVARLDPWIDLTAATVHRLTARSLLAGVVPDRQVARALVAFYAGVEQLYRLDRDEARAIALFATLERVAGLVSPLLTPVRPARKGSS